jgi:Immunity protein Imm1
MQVSAIEREYQVKSREELESVLMRRVLNNENQFWLNHDGQEYPVLAISVKGEIAYVYYVPYDRCAGFQSIGRIHGLQGHSTDFSIGLHDTISVQNEFVVPFSAALNAANEFFESADLPSSIEWYEL